MVGDTSFEQHQLASLCVMANEGLRRATVSLSELTKQPFSMAAPQVGSVVVADIPQLLGGRDRLTVSVTMRITGDIEGHLAFLAPWESAQRLWSMLLGWSPDRRTELDELATSAMTELGNIVNSTLLSAISDLTRLRVQAEPPSFDADSAREVLTHVAGAGRPIALAMQTVVHAADQETMGLLLCIPTAASLKLLAVRLAAPEAA